MQPGPMRKRVTVYANQPLTGQFGGEKANWVPITPVSTFWARFSPQLMMSNENEHAQQQVAIRFALVTLRYAASVSITPAHRLLMNGRWFAVERVINADERNRELTLGVKEIA